MNDAQWTMLLDDIRPQAQSIASKMVGSDADDMVQEAYCRAWRSRNSFRGHASATTWVNGILINACIETKRRRRETEEIGDDSNLVSSDLSPFEQVAAPESFLVVRALVRLEPAKREFLEQWVNGWSYRQMAEHHGITVNTVKSRMRQARKRLLWICQQISAVSGEVCYTVGRRF